MPKSHICPSCLTELGSIRAVPDPHCGLGIVVCPSCSLASVRTRHPDIEFWRGVRRTHQAARNLFAKIILSVLAGLLMWAMVMASEDLFSLGVALDPLYPFLNGDQQTALEGAAILGVSVILMGIVVSLFWHRSVLVGAGVFLVISFFFVTIEYQVIWANHAIGFVGGFDPDVSLPRTREMAGRLFRFGYLGAVSLLGIVPAYMLRGIIQRTETRKFRRLLRKRRKQRTIHD